MNKVHLDGTVRWAAHRVTKTGLDISNIRLRCTGESGKPATVDCDFWVEMAKAVKHVGMGDRMVVEGEVRNKPAQHKEGKWQVIINVYKIVKIEKGDGSNPAPARAGVEFPDADPDDDMPF